MIAAPSTIHRKVALVVTGGTLTALADDSLEVLDYGRAGSLSALGLLERAPRLAAQTEIVAVDCGSAPSFQVYLPHWRRMVDLFHDLFGKHPDLAGIVMTHGTGSLEETAFLLSLVWDLPIPLAITGAQRPASSLSGDGWMNLAQAIQAVQDPSMRELGVAVVMNGEIHLAADVTKTSNLGVETFRSPDLGPVGHVVGLSPVLYRRPEPARSLTSRFVGALLKDLPRVDIVYCHTGGDRVAIDAFIAAGARGIVLAGFAPGYATDIQAKVLEDWIRDDGGLVIHASRAAGPSVSNSRNAGHGFMPSGRFTPAKARLLLQLALQAGMEGAEIKALFQDH